MEGKRKKKKKERKCRDDTRSQNNAEKIDDVKIPITEFLP